jgi:hypothetical protein
VGMLGLQFSESLTKMLAARRVGFPLQGVEAVVGRRFRLLLNGQATPGKITLPLHDGEIGVHANLELAHQGAEETLSPVCCASASVSMLCPVSKSQRETISSTTSW